MFFKRLQIVQASELPVKTGFPLLYIVAPFFGAKNLYNEVFLPLNSGMKMHVYGCSYANSANVIERPY